MSPEQQRIKIAKYCGWIDIGRVGKQKAPRGLPPGYDGPLKGLHNKTLPDFLNDLNAMREAEKVLCETHPDAAYAYDQKWLPNVTGAYQDAGLLNTLRLWHATAAQRAEALLKTLNLWEDAP